MVSVVVMFVGCCVVVFVFSMHYSCALSGFIYPVSLRMGDRKGSRSMF